MQLKIFLIYYRIINKIMHPVNNSIYINYTKITNKNRKNNTPTLINNTLLILAAQSIQLILFENDSKNSFKRPIQKK